jgi:hypothetical protein
VHDRADERTFAGGSRRGVPGQLIVHLARRLPHRSDNDIIISVPPTEWSVDLHPACEGWIDVLDQGDSEALLAAIRVLRAQGPALGRPLVDTIQGSRHSNMKELRPGSTGRTEVRVLFAFDLERKAILLVGGDKSDDWSGWYDKNIPIADDRFSEHQAALEAKRKAKPAAEKAQGQKSRRERRR